MFFLCCEPHEPVERVGEGEKRKSQSECVAFERLWCLLLYSIVSPRQYDKTLISKPRRKITKPKNKTINEQTNQSDTAYHLLLLYQVAPQVQGPAGHRSRSDASEECSLADSVSPNNTVPSPMP